MNKENKSQPYWMAIVLELMSVKKYTYADIAEKIKISSDTVKLLTHDIKFIPDPCVFIRLLSFYYHELYNDTKNINIKVQQRLSKLSELSAKFDKSKK